MVHGLIFNLSICTIRIKGKKDKIFFNNWSAFLFEQIVLLFPHCYKVDFIADLIHKKEHRFTRSLNLSFLYTDDVLSLNNPNFGDLIHCKYPKELDIKDTTDTGKSVSYLYHNLKIDGKGKLLTKV